MAISFGDKDIFMNVVIPLPSKERICVLRVLAFCIFKLARLLGTAVWDFTYIIAGYKQVKFY
jgi:hypothetical protein